ncbi:MAG: hypothetical protein ABJF23_20645 [Bryobacteraceae bacterium]
MGRTFAAALVSSILLTGCGYVGDPLPPALNIPQKVTDLRALQRGGMIVIDFTVPVLTTENLPVKRLGLPDLQIGDRQVEAPPDKGHIEVPVKDWIGQDAAVRVRINNDRGRYSDWSNTVLLSVVPTLDPPANVSAKSDSKGVRLTWAAGAGEKWRVVRVGDAKTVEVDHPEYVDEDAAYGKEVQYKVVALLKTAESEPSAVVAITPRDEFPPAVPAGLTALAGLASVELSWDRNTEEDLKGYRMYRALDAGPFAAIADLVEDPSYSDKTVSAGAKYRYAVSSIDRAGNESAKSAAIEIAMPQ